MKNYLVRWKSNWADEIDFDGVVIFKEKDKKRFDEEVKILKKLEKEYGDSDLSVCVGSNEDIEYSDSNEMLKEITFKEINEDEAKMLKKLKLSSVGAIDAIEYILNGEFIDRFEDLGDDKQVEDIIGEEAYDKYTDYYELDD